MAEPQKYIREAREHRQAKQAARQARADKLPPSSYYDGQDGVTGLPLVRSSGGVASPFAPLSNVQGEIGQQGRGIAGSFDVGTRRSPALSKKRTPKGEVAVLVRQVEGDRQRFWIGGDRSSPTQVADLPVSAGSVSATLELTGAGKTDWIVSLKYGTTAQVVFGSGEGSWTVTDPRVALVGYKGNGFWNSGSVYSASREAFASLTSEPFATMDGLQSQLGDVIGSGCHSQIEGFTTIAVAYCESYSITGQSQLSKTGYDRRNGIVPNNSIFTFSGTNSYDYTQTTNASYEGVASGPGFLGPGGDFCTIGAPGVTGTATFPRKRANQTYTLTRNFSAQTYSLSLFAAAISLSAGAESLSGAGSGSADLGANGSVKRVEFLGDCRSYSSPDQDIWSIFVTELENWNSVNPSSSGNVSPVVYDYFNSFAIAPGVNKTISFNGQRSGNTDAATAIGTKAGYSTSFVFNDGVFYFELLGSGNFELDLVDGPRNSPPTTDTRTNLLFGGSEYTATGSFSQGYTWQTDPENNLPVAYSVDVEDTIFEKAGKVEVTKIKASLSGEAINFASEEETTQAKVLKINLAGTKTVIQAKYWAKN